MISKKVPMKNPRKSSFGNLTKYLTDEQGKLERLGEVFVTNCHSDNPVWAALEVEATQALNARAISDKTYHLLISFREGENPTAEVLRDIEKTLCDALGYGEHQRVSVVHRDTDNLHMHVAINKIHPTNLTLHEPYRDHKTRDQVCALLEEKHGLERDNHKHMKTVGQAKAADMENMSGLQSLQSYAKALVPQLEQVDSWKSLHKVLNENGLNIQKQGAGLVIVSDEGVTVKASSVSRLLSIKTLTDKLGPFEESSFKFAAKKSYSAEPVSMTADTPNLYAKYTEQRHTFSKARTDAWRKAKEERERAITLAKNAAALKRAALRFAERGIIKKLTYKHISTELQKDIKNINLQHKQQREQIYSKFTRPVWQDWLKQQALGGNAAAAEVLRKRKGQAKTTDTNNFEGATGVKTEGPIPGAPINSVTTKGSLVYKVANTPIRDTGATLVVSRWPTKNGLLAGLHMAMHRYGSSLKINGTAQFKTSVAKLAAEKKLALTFDDPALEQLRQTYLHNPTSQDIYHDNRTRPANQRHVDGTGSGHERSGVSATRQSGTGYVGRRHAGHIQPNIGKIGTNPPPESQNRLRPLSECRLVQFTSGSEVLLPSHVHDVVEQQKTGANRELRRDVFGPGVKKPDQKKATDSVNKYVNERNGLREKVFDISHHRRYTETDAGQLVFAGVRNVDGQSMALLRKDKEILVLPIDAKTAARLGRLRLGSPVSVSDQGNVSSKGRSR